MDSKLQLALERAYGRTNGFDADDYLHAYGNPRDALLYSALFSPELVEISGHVFLKLAIGKAYAEAMRSNMAATSLDWHKAQKENNWIEVPYLFADREIDEDSISLLAVKLCDSWRAWLRFKFPERRFNVVILGPEITGSVLGIGFHQTS